MGCKEIFSLARFYPTWKYCNSMIGITLGPRLSLVANGQWLSGEGWIVGYIVSFITLVLLVTSVRGQVLRDPGPLCPGQTATITCDTSGGIRGSNAASWNYNGVLVNTIIPGFSTFPASRNVSGVEFTVLDTEIEFMFLISFVASDRMNGGTLDCVGNGLMSSVTLQVEPATGK